jgi:hypothetical protein
VAESVVADFSLAWPGPGCQKAVRGIDEYCLELLRGEWKSSTDWERGYCHFVGNW